MFSEQGREAQQLFAHQIHVDRAAVEDLQQDLIAVVQGAGDLVTQTLLVEQVLHPDPDAGDLVAVRRADTAAGGADLLLPGEPFGDLVEFHVVRRDDVRVGTDHQTVGADPAGLQALHLPLEHGRVDDNSVGDDRDTAGVKMPDGNRCNAYFRRR